MSTNVSYCIGLLYFSSLDKAKELSKKALIRDMTMEMINGWWILRILINLFVFSLPKKGGFSRVMLYSTLGKEPSFPLLGFPGSSPFPSCLTCRWGRPNETVAIQWYPGPKYCKKRKWCPVRWLGNVPLQSHLAAAFMVPISLQNILHTTFRHGKVDSCNPKWVVVPV